MPEQHAAPRTGVPENFVLNTVLCHTERLHIGRHSLGCGHIKGEYMNFTVSKHVVLLCCLAGSAVGSVVPPIAPPATATITITYHHCANPPSCVPDSNDVGSVSITVNGFSETQNYVGNPGAASIASNFAASFNGNPGSPVTATVSGSTITLTATVNGSRGDYAFSTTAQDKNTGINQPAQFGATPTSGSLK